MKMFVVLALAAFAAAEPEADPQLLLGGIHGVHSSYTPYSHVAPVATYASPLWKNVIPALKSVVPAVKTVVPEVKPVVSTPVISSYTGLGARFPLTYGSGLIRTPFTGINTPYTAGVISPYSGLTHTAVKTVVPAVSSYTGLGACGPAGCHPMTHGVVAAPTKVVTNYINNDHYTAEATPLGKALGVPSYTAKNGEVVHEVQKREADPALVYSGLTHTPFTGINTPYTAGVISPYSGLTHTSFTGINTPYTAGMISPYTGLTHGIQYRMPYGVQYPMTHAVQKREAEADPTLVYSGLTHTPFTGINTPYTAGVISPYSGLTGITTPYTAGVISPYSGLTHTAIKTVVPAVSTPVVSSYTGLTHTPVYKSQDHGVVATYAGLVHSSHAGLCLNNEGVQVAC